MVGSAISKRKAKPLRVSDKRKSKGVRQWASFAWVNAISLTHKSKRGLT